MKKKKAWLKKRGQIIMFYAMAATQMDGRVAQRCKCEVRQECLFLALPRRILRCKGESL